MTTKPPSEPDDRLANILRQAFPQEPVPEGLAARIVAAAENSRSRDPLAERSGWSADRRRAVATAVCATACGLALGISLGLSAFGGGRRPIGDEAGPSVTYLALLSGYTDVEDTRP